MDKALQQIRALKASDDDAVRSIYLEGIATGNATFETVAPNWQEWDAAHLKHSRIVMVAGKVIAGWAALSPVSKREVYRGVAEVSVYVAAEYRGKGIGDQLLEALVAESEKNGIWTLTASIFAENAASLKLHEKHGFKMLGRRTRIAKLHGIWRDTLFLERRSAVTGTD